MLLLLLAIGAALLVCTADEFHCHSYSTVEDLFLNKSSSTVAQLSGRADGVGALLQHTLYLAAYVRYRGWGVEDILGQLSMPSDHAINKTLFLDFMFPNLTNIGKSVLSEQPLHVIDVQSSRDLDNLQAVENTTYALRETQFDLEVIANIKNQTLDDYFTSDFLAIMRNLTICSVKRELSERSLFHKHGSKKLRVVAHVRRGDVLDNHENRYTPDVFFIGVLKTIRDIYPHAELHVFTSRSDSRESDMIWKEYWDSGIHVHLTEEYLSTNTEKTITALAHFMSADVFMMSKSTFSSVPAFYNPNCVLYTPFYHGRLKNWITLPADFNLDVAKGVIQSELIPCIEALRHPHLGRNVTTL